jgi:hypothetical protein
MWHQGEQETHAAPHPHRAALLASGSGVAARQSFRVQGEGRAAMRGSVRPFAFQLGYAPLQAFQHVA